MFDALKTMSHCKVVYYGFKIICIIATLALVSMWIRTYFLDTDIPTIETKSYFDTTRDSVPVYHYVFNKTLTAPLSARLQKMSLVQITRSIFWDATMILIWRILIMIR